MELPSVRTMPPGAKPAKLVRDQGSWVILVECARCGAKRAKVLKDAKEAVKVRDLYLGGGFHPDGHVQDVFPDWTAEEREVFLQSHLCGGCWESLPGGDAD